MTLLDPDRRLGRAKAWLKLSCAATAVIAAAGLAAEPARAQAFNGTPQTVSVVTLLVNPDQAERLTLASNEGRIQLALRNPLDMEDTKTSGIRLAALMRGGAAPAPEVNPVTRRAAPRPRPAAPVPVVAPPPPAAPPIYRVETIRGIQRKEEVVN